MSTILSNAMITNAQSAVDTYLTAANGHFQALEAEISGLRAANFNGEASDGYQYFFDNKVKPAVDTNLNELSKSIKDMLNSIRDQLIGTVDPQLGQNNQNPAQ